MAIVASNQISIVDVTDGAEGKGATTLRYLRNTIDSNQSVL